MPRSIGHGEKPFESWNLATASLQDSARPRVVQCYIVRHPGKGCTRHSALLRESSASGRPSPITLSTDLSTEQRFSCHSSIKAIIQARSCTSEYIGQTSYVASRYGGQERPFALSQIDARYVTRPRDWLGWPTPTVAISRREKSGRSVYMPDGHAPPAPVVILRYNSVSVHQFLHDIFYVLLACQSIMLAASPFGWAPCPSARQLPATLSLRRAR